MPGASGIIRLTVINIAGQNRSPRSTPCLVSHETLGCAVDVVDFELGEQCQAVTVDVAPSTTKAEPPTVPAIAQHGPNGVAAFLQKPRHIERLVAQPMVVAGPSGVQNAIANGGAIELRFIDAQGRHIEPRP